MDRRLIHFALQLPPHIKRQPQFKYILRQAVKGILPDTVRLRTGKTSFSHFRRKGLTRESVAFEEMRRNPVLAQLGFVNPKQWEAELTRYKLGILNPYNIFRPSVDMKFSLSVEVWLSTCLPQFSTAYSRVKGT